jgi:protein-disulfide isomerase
VIGHAGTNESGLIDPTRGAGSAQPNSAQCVMRFQSPATAHRPSMTNAPSSSRVAGPKRSISRPGSIVCMNARQDTASALPVPSGATSEGDGIAIGNGPARVDVFIDFQCPFCKRFELAAQPTIDKLLDQQMVSFVRHPMNFLDRVSATAYSTRAAAASAAAADADMFNEYARALFISQPPEGGPGLSDAELVELGEEIGVSDPAFAQTIRRGLYLPWPEYVTQRAVARGVGGTPSLFVDGIPVPARPDVLHEAVQRVLT